MSSDSEVPTDVTSLVRITGRNLLDGGAPFPVEATIHVVEKCVARRPEVVGIEVRGIDSPGFRGTSIDIHFDEPSLRAMGYGKPIGFSVTCRTVVEFPDDNGQRIEAELGAFDGDDRVTADQIDVVYDVVSESNSYGKVKRMSVDITVEPAF